MSPIIVLHAMGDANAGAPWREAGVDAPDLPGHGSAPAPVGGAYDAVDPVVAIAQLVSESDPPVIVGHGSSARAAEIFALGGRAARLVLLDGLGGAHRDADTVMAELFAWVRAISDDEEAMAPPPPSGLDPRLRHGVPDQAHEIFDAQLRASITVPVLLLETPSSPTSSADRAARAATFGGEVQVELLPDAAPATVLDAVQRWLDR